MHGVDIALLCLIPRSCRIGTIGITNHIGGEVTTIREGPNRRATKSALHALLRASAIGMLHFVECNATNFGLFCITRAAVFGVMTGALTTSKRRHILRRARRKKTLSHCPAPMIGGVSRGVVRSVNRCHCHRNIPSIYKGVIVDIDAGGTEGHFHQIGHISRLAALETELSILIPTPSRSTAIRALRA